MALKCSWAEMTNGNCLASRQRYKGDDDDKIECKVS